MKAKKLIVLMIAVLAMVLSLTGCESASFETTTLGNKTTIKVNDAEDGKDSETLHFSVGKGSNAIISSSLEKGKLQLDFVKVTVHTRENEPDEIIYNDTDESFTVQAGTIDAVPLDGGEYVIKIKAIGNTNGSVTVEIER